MSVTITVRDETTGSDESHETVMEFLTEELTVRELIRSRVYQEVEDFNRNQPEVFRSLVKPTEAEETLNGFRLPKRRKLDWKKQFDAAVAGFERNAFILLVDDKQMAGLDDQLTITPATTVTFLKLVPLVGG